jgi:hypothetical protein
LRLAAHNASAEFIGMGQDITLRKPPERAKGKPARRLSLVRQPNHAATFGCPLVAMSGNYETRHDIPSGITADAFYANGYGNPGVLLRILSEMVSAPAVCAHEKPGKPSPLSTRDYLYRRRHLQVRHGTSGKQTAGRLGQPAGPAR